MNSTSNSLLDLMIERSEKCKEEGITSDRLIRMYQEWFALTPHGMAEKDYKAYLERIIVYAFYSY